MIISLFLWRIQIQHLLKLNDGEDYSKSRIAPNSNTTLVKVKLFLQEH